MSSRALRFVGWALLGAGCVGGLSPNGISPNSTWLAALFAWAAGLAWLRRDAIDRRIPLPYDWSWLMTVSWPVSWIWYGRRSRRSWSAAFGLAALPIAFPLGALLTQLAALFRR